MNKEQLALLHSYEKQIKEENKRVKEYSKFAEYLERDNPQGALQVMEYVKTVIDSANTQIKEYEDLIEGI